MFGGGMIKKVIMYLLMGPMSFLMGRFNIMDFFMIPMIAPMLSGMFGGLLPGGTAGAAGATT